MDLTTIDLGFVLDQLHDKKVFLEKLLNKANSLTEKDFNTALDYTLREDVDLSVEYLKRRDKKEEAVQLYEETKKYVNAAKLCQKYGWKDKAVKNYELAGEIQLAVEVYLGVSYKTETKEGKKDYSLELTTAEEKGDYEKAAKLAKNLGMINKAAQHFKKAGKQEEAEELLKNSNPLLAARVWERNGKVLHAINLLSRNEFFDEMCEVKKKANDFLSAGNSYFSRGKHEEALDCYRKANYSEGIEKMLKHLGRTEELILHWEKTGKSDLLAEYYEEKNPMKAAVHYESAKNYVKAGDCLVSAGKNISALKLLIDHGKYEAALKLKLNLAKDEEEPTKVLLEYCHERLAEEYESSNLEKSLEHYILLGNSEKFKKVANKLSKDHSAKGNFKKAVTYAEIAGNNSDVLKAAIKWLE